MLTWWDIVSHHDDMLLWRSWPGKITLHTPVLASIACVSTSSAREGWWTNQRGALKHLFGPTCIGSMIRGGRGAWTSANFIPWWNLTSKKLTWQHSISHHDDIQIWRSQLGQITSSHFIIFIVAISALLPWAASCQFSKNI